MASTATFCKSVKVKLRVSLRAETTMSMRSPGSTMPDSELISSTGTVTARWPDCRRAEKVGARRPSSCAHRMGSPAEYQGNIPRR